MSSKLSWILLAGMLLIAQDAWGQLVRGRVTDLQGWGVKDCYILQDDKGLHTHTDNEGFFALDGVKAGDTLRVSHISYSSTYRVVEELPAFLDISLEKAPLELEGVTIRHELKSINMIAEIDLRHDPVQSSQEILRSVPGLVIGQHAGGGKAEQIFLRGFDIDHGTDIAISVDGMPVNMVSHAHGQGYADLHFLIPEIVSKVDFGKGPYYADYGNFATSGYVNFETARSLESSEVRLGMGEFGYRRLLGLFQLVDEDRHQAYIASEYLMGDGAFVSPQNLRRVNLIGRYTGLTEAQGELSVTVSHFRSRWEASGQVPQRAVDSGLIDRFGAIDDTEGGTTSRSNLGLRYDVMLGDHAMLRNSVYLARYDFDLFSNFTFFLNDSVNGDQIRQQESRQIFGAGSEYLHSLHLRRADIRTRIGVGLRYDRVTDIGLTHTASRKVVLEEIQSGDIDEADVFAFADFDIESGPWLFNPALRVDHFDFAYADALSQDYALAKASRTVFSPKLNIIYQASSSFQAYLKSGIGFHSNDTRVVLDGTADEILPRAMGSDLGMMWKPASRTFINAALWYLYLEQEFVYVGDEGIVEPSGRSRRAGIDLGIRQQAFDFLYLQADINYAYARSIDEPAGDDYIPLAPDLTLAGAVLWSGSGHWSGGLHARHVKSRPANEDYSITALGYTVIDLNLGYRWKRAELSLVVENLLDSDWNETQFATLSRLQGETFPVEEIHFIPGTPRFVRMVLGLRF